MIEQRSDIAAMIGPALTETTIVLSGRDAVHRAKWVCGCSVEALDGDPDLAETSVHWYRCKFHRRSARQLSAV